MYIKIGAECLQPVDPRRFFSASRCITSTSAELHANAVSTVAQPFLKIFKNWRWKRGRRLDPRRIFKRPAPPERRYMVWSGDVDSSALVHPHCHCITSFIPLSHKTVSRSESCDPTRQVLALHVTDDLHSHRQVFGSSVTLVWSLLRSETICRYAC